MKYVVNDQVVLMRPPEGPLAAFVRPFSRWASEQGYRLASLRQRVRIAVGFSRWLAETADRPCSVSSQHCAEYLRYRARRLRIHPGDAVALSQFLDHLRREGIVPVEQISVPRLTSAEQCVQAYEQYLLQGRALSKATAINYVPFIREFVKCRFGTGRVRLSCLTARDVVRFVQRRAPRLHRKRAKLMTSALRSFLQYARFRGELVLDLAAAVPVVAQWSMPAIPRAIGPDQVRQLLASIDRRTAIGRRDYAILLLLARLGLRSSEVVFLELDDLDWNGGQLNVRGKSGQRSELPLSSEVGKAIAAYLRRGRPESAIRRVFLSAKAPIRGFRGASGVGSIVRHSLKRADIDAPTCGAHQFRHGLATEMLRQGASLAEIGEVLGHRHPQTTKIYTKVDVEALRTLALPWPGGAR